MKAKDKLYNLYAEVKEEGNCKEYVHEMFEQLKMFGTETNTLTKDMVRNGLKELLNNLESSKL